MRIAKEALAYEPTEADWLEYEAMCNAQDGEFDVVVSTDYKGRAVNRAEDLIF